MSLPDKVTIIEVGPRDGLQNEKNTIPTETKIQFIKALKQANIQEMELTSFVSPKWVPQMKDADDVIEQCLDNTRNFVLAPNQKGVERFYQSGANDIAVFVGVSNTFNKKNINKSTDESLEELKPLIADLKQNGKFVRACVSTAFYCPYEGKVPAEKTIKLCEAFAHCGVNELSVADTVGMATPKEVYQLFNSLKSIQPKNILITGHFHNTRGTALANIYASLEAGVDRFDSSAGGLGGCPFAPGATGNVATEDVLYMLHGMGIDTGVDIEKVIHAVDVVAPFMTRTLDSKLYHLQKATASTEA
ncbi:hydroxymethylglutaryl-CoA lyase [Scopulibacillus daqui]|uniref:Hydroxymethylglutaryl-CoA lyase n=1 Tax=Scopulibacillus daqui TaxID=1469162 RepID=A0ABS2Q1X2_9BACL|nr:hydroxymethylglutaryl-CoA lyase [Scopulibacillus daqui]MBM7646196.1 hydroxymethylglutaryl-CoA lyase [Scopulibacillus daqui]